MATSLNIFDELFSFNGRNVKVVGTCDNPWFCGKDVCDILCYSKYRDALAKHVDDDCKKNLKDVVREVVHAAWTTSLTTSFKDISFNEGLACYINEEGLYSLILSSNLPSAKLFRKWVTSEVLPSIRKKGEYKLKMELQELRKHAIKTEEQLRENKDQLREKEELLHEKDKKIEIELRYNERVTEMIAKMKCREKLQFIYIATTQQYASTNRFKIGGVKSQGLLKGRLATYNTGRPKGDKMYFCYIKDCVDYHQLEKRIEQIIGCHRDEKNAEMYIVHYLDLNYILDFISTSYESDLNMHTGMFDNIVRNVVSRPPVIPEPIVLNGVEYRSRRDGIVVTKESMTDWDEMSKEEQKQFAYRVMEDFIANVTDNSQPILRKQIEQHIVEKFNAKFKRNEFWTFIKSFSQSKGVVVKYR